MIFIIYIDYLNNKKIPYFAVYNEHPRFCVHHTWHYYAHGMYHYIPMYNVHPYFSLKNLGKKVLIIHGNIWYLKQICEATNNR